MEDGSVCTEPKHTLPYTLNQLSVTHDHCNVNAVSIKKHPCIFSAFFPEHFQSTVGWIHSVDPRHRGLMCFSHVTVATVLPQCLWKCKFPNCRTALRTGA